MRGLFATVRDAMLGIYRRLQGSPVAGAVHPEVGRAPETIPKAATGRPKPSVTKPGRPH